MFEVSLIQSSFPFNFFAVDLHLFYQKVSNLGGYEGCMSKKAWKTVYDELGGNPQNTSAATCTRRHYEKSVRTDRQSFHRLTKAEAFSHIEVHILKVLL